MDEERLRFTVEKTPLSGYGIGNFHIRYRPPKSKNADGTTTFGLSFPILIAGVMLDDQEIVLQSIADALNATEIGR